MMRARQARALALQQRSFPRYVLRPGEPNVLRYKLLRVTRAERRATLRVDMSVGTVECSDVVVVLGSMSDRREGRCRRVRASGGCPHWSREDAREQECRNWFLRPQHWRSSQCPFGRLGVYNRVRM